MAAAKYGYKNVSGHPLDVGGQVLATDEFGKFEAGADAVKDLVDAGQLALQGEAATATATEKKEV